MSLQHEAPIYRLGNILCEYFVDVAQRWANDSAESVDTTHLSWLRNHIPTANLSSRVPGALRREIACLVTDPRFRKVKPGAHWRPERLPPDLFFKFWSIMRRYVYNTLNDAFISSGVATDENRPVVHLRCSDVPFCRHPGYHFPKKSYYRWCLDRMGEVDRVLILSSNTHNLKKRSRLTACRRYTDFVVETFSDAGIHASVQCESAIEDFAKMFYAPSVISTGSSFSFIAGYASGDFFSCQCLEENNKIIIPSHPAYYDAPPLLHQEVDSYHDADAVIDMLDDVQ